MAIGNWLKNNATTILTILGAGGFVTTVVLAVKATPRAMEDIENAKIDKAEEMEVGEGEKMLRRNPDGTVELPKLTIVETVKVCVEDYMPATLAGLGTIGCMFGANALSRKQQASWASAYTGAVGMFEAYKDRIQAMCGKPTADAVEKAMDQEKQDAEDGRPPWDQIQTFYVELGEGDDKESRLFEATMEQVVNAEYAFNRALAVTGEASFNEFLAFLNLSPMKCGTKNYDGQWLDFYHRWFLTDDGMEVCGIEPSEV